jgi:hypothetical protein
MAACDTPIRIIDSTECLKDSLKTINDNFKLLEDATCELEQRVENDVQIRTFFYYGPNSAVTPDSGMQDDTISRPSNLTIQAFVNSPSQLNLPEISKNGDIAYVVYQKTGFYSTSVTKAGDPVVNRVISVNNATYSDVINYASPIIIIWKLTCSTNSSNVKVYTVDVGFPKFTRASTNPTTNDASWNLPQNWSTYT